MIDSDNNMIALADEIYSQLNLKPLTRRQRLFVLRFDGRKPIDVAADAEYKNPGVAACRLMSIPAVRECIDIISKTLEKTLIASKLDVLMFWTKIMESETEETPHRLSASEKLGRIHELLGPAAITNVKVNSDNKIVIMVQSHKPVDDAERKEYQRLEDAIAEDQHNELLTMGKRTCRRITGKVVEGSDLII